MKFKSRINSFLDKETQFEGHLSFTGAIRIDGRFNGSIQSSGTLVIGREGRVEAEINVGKVVLAGEVRGRIIATESVEIQFPARIFGDIQSPTITIQKGVVVEGNCRTLPPRQKASPLKLSLVRGRSVEVDGHSGVGADTGS